MLRLIAFLTVFTVGCWPAAAQTLNERLKEGYRELDAGDAAQALADFQDARIDAPDSDVVNYSIAHAQYVRGINEVKSGATPAALEDLEAARGAFRELETSADPFIRENARFNAANSAAQIAKASMGAGDREKTVEMFKDAVSEYEQVLQVNPNHREAEQNLSHMRYLLKRMLQNPPEQQQQENEQQEGEDNPEGKQEEQQKQEDGKGEDSENQQQGEQDQSAGNKEDQEQQQPQNGEDSSAQDAAGGEEDSANQDQDRNRQNIEAILQSLEDQDRQQQKDLRKAKESPRIREGKWW